MTAEDINHFRAIGRAAAGGGDYFGGFFDGTPIEVGPSARSVLAQ